MLRGIIPPQPAHVVYVDHLERRGTELFRFVCESDLAGIIAKRKDSIYVSNGAAAWVKVKNRNYSQARGRREMFESFRSTMHIKMRSPAPDPQLQAMRRR